jgi:HEPN domain-containing protein
VQPSDTLVDFARMLDKHYIPTSTPNGFDIGAPTDFYTGEEAQNAIRYAAALLDFSRDQIK